MLNRLRHRASQGGQPHETSTPLKLIHARFFVEKKYSYSRACKTLPSRPDGIVSFSQVFLDALPWFALAEEVACNGHTDIPPGSSWRIESPNKVISNLRFRLQ